MGARAIPISPPTMIVAILLLTVAAYGNSLLGEFVWDDLPLIVENRDIKEPAALWRLFASEFRLSPDDPTSFYRPLTMISLYLDQMLWGLNPFGYHLTNLLLHLMATFLFYRVGRTLFSETASLVAAIIFALHPVHTESVSFISGRTDILCAIFYLAAILLYRKRENSFRWLAASVACFALALLSKEMAITLPVVLFLLDAQKAPGKVEWNRLLIRIAPFLVIIAGYMAVRGQVLGGKALPLPSPEALFMAAMMAPLLAAEYLFILLFPWKLNALYVMDIVKGLGDPLLLFGWAVTFTMAALSIVLWRKGKRDWSLPVLWFLLTLTPVLNLLQTGSAPMAERFAYIPSMGFCWFFGLSLAALLKVDRKTMRHGTLLVLAALALFYGVRTMARNADWRDEFALFSRLVETSPNSAVAHFNLGCLYRDRQDWENARVHWAEAIRLDPSHAASHNNLGALFDTLGMKNEALSEYQAAVRLNPRNAAAWYNLGRIYREKGMQGEAAESFRRYQEMSR